MSVLYGEEARKAIEGATISVVQGATEGSDRVTIVTNYGDLTLYHAQDCCEHVELSDATGLDSRELVGAVVSELRVVSDPQQEGYGGSVTWTFYRLLTDRGPLILTWKGESNGYYSEEVDVMFEPRQHRENSDD